MRCGGGKEKPKSNAESTRSDEEYTIMIMCVEYIFFLCRRHKYTNSHTTTAAFIGHAKHVPDNNLILYTYINNGDE